MYFSRRTCLHKILQLRNDRNVEKTVSCKEMCKKKFVKLSGIEKKISLVQRRNIKEKQTLNKFMISAKTMSKNVKVNNKNKKQECCYNVLK